MTPTAVTSPLTHPPTDEREMSGRRPKYKKKIFTHDYELQNKLKKQQEDLEEKELKRIKNMEERKRE